MGITRPCHGCTMRHQGCHATCPDGIAADEAHKEEMTLLRDAKRAEGDFRGYKHSIRCEIDKRLCSDKRGRKRRK